MTVLDWLIVATYLAFALGVGVLFRRRAGRNLAEYFLSGRNLPWWIVGTSMVATTFAADTPLAVTGLVGNDGIAGNWLLWNFAAAHLWVTVFFARLWRRAGVLTDLELVDLRYSGRPARVLRAFRAVWEGAFLNCIIMGWVILAMVKIMGVVIDLDVVGARLGLPAAVDGRWVGIGILLTIAVAYTVLSGFWGVVVTDVAQFLLATAGAVVLAVVAVADLGGLTGLRLELAARFGAEADSLLAFFPDGSDASLPWLTFVALIGVNWWATRDAGGQGYIVQRMLAAKDEQHSFLGSLWFCVANYVIRPWPWILVGLAALVVFPDLTDRELGYPLMIVEYLPAGLLGLMMASLLAAFMSTIDSILNWGVSLLVNDGYRPFVNQAASDRHYVLVSRALIVGLMVAGGVSAYVMESVRGAWELFFGMTVGIGGVLVVRWWWWRVNTWSEISAWLSTAAVYLTLAMATPGISFGWHLITTALVSTVCWVVVTLVTPPTDAATLLAFYERVRPGTPWWGPVARRSRWRGSSTLWSDLVDWVAGVGFTFGAMFGVGKLLLGEPAFGAGYLALAGVSAATLVYRLRSEGISGADA